MALPLRVKNLDNIPESLHSEYKKVGDEYVLDLDTPVVPKSQLEEFRNNNIELKKKAAELEEQVQRYAGIDPEKAREAQKKLDEMNAKKLVDEGKIDELLDIRTQSMRAEFEQQQQALKEARDKEQKRAASLYQQLMGTKIESSITQAVNRVGRVRKGAMDDILLRARHDWKMDEEGNLIPAHTLVSSTGEKITKVDEYADHLSRVAGYLFESGGGGGSAGGHKGSNNDEEGVVYVPKDKQVLSEAELKAMAEGKLRRV